MDTEQQLPSDGQLLAAARDGISQAWGELVRRHGGAVEAVAKARNRRRSKKSAQRALDHFHGVVSAVDVVDDGEPAVRAVRPLAISSLTNGSYGPGDRAEGDGADADPAALHSLARAFATLPEPWQTALWHRTVELQPGAEYAPLLGRTANEARVVVQRAEAGLFEAFLLDQTATQSTERGAERDAVGDAVDDACVPIVPLLGGSLRTTLSAHQQRLVDEHVHGIEATGIEATGIEATGIEATGDATGDATGEDTGCAACRRRIAVNDELGTLLPAAIVPGLTGLPVDRYRAAVKARPLPAGDAASGGPPVFVRRLAFVGALALVVLAITAAVVLIRNGFDGDAGPATTDTGTPGDTSGPTTSAGGATTDGSTSTSTTEVDIRPAVQGPANVIELVFAEGTRAVGFAPAPEGLSLELTSPAPIFAGGTGTIDLAITNAAASPAVANFTIDAPRGVELDQLVDGEAECDDPADVAAFCNVTVGAGETSVVTVRFSLSGSIVGRFIVESRLASEPLEVQIFAIPRLVHSSVGRGDIVMVGNTLMTCPDSVPVCADARNGVGEVVNRWDIPTEFIGADRSVGWTNSSSATVDTNGAGIVGAYLFWSGDLKERGTEIPDDGSNAVVSILVPNADDPFDITAERIRLGDIDATQYFGFADVTDIVRFAGPGDYVIGNVQSVEVQGSYAGWSLVVVTEDDTMPRRHLVVSSPFTWFSPADVYAATIPVPPGTAQTAMLDVLAFEGERGFVPEQLTAGGVALGDEGAFDSTIIGEREPSFVNNFGIDIDAYALSIDAPDGILPLEATSGMDGVRLAVLGLAVDLE